MVLCSDPNVYSENILLGGTKDGKPFYFQTVQIGLLIILLNVVKNMKLLHKNIILMPSVHL